MKTCSKCAADKPATEFGPRKSSRDGLLSWCRQCERARLLEWLDANRESAAKRRRDQYAANKTEVLKRQADYRERNREDIKARANARAKDPEFRAKRTAYEKEYRSLPGNRNRYLECLRAWAKRNRPKKTADLQLRRAAERRAVVPQDMELLKLATQEALHLAQLRERLSGVKWELDHIVPIRGKKVWGLHVPANFQVIPMSANRRKSNKFEVAA